MQQRIVLKVAIKKDKDRSKAMKIAVGAIGVSSVMIGGEDRNIVIVIGNEVDIVTLTQSLVKKFGSATLVRVEPLNDIKFYENEAPAAASIIYEGQRSDYYSNSYGQPYNNLPVQQQYYPPPTTQYYYACERPGDSGCSIM